MRRWEEAYLREGHFDQDAMLALIQEVLEEGRRQDFPMTRLVANMEWALEDRPGVDDIVEYESRLNYILPKYDDTVVCTYDLAKFSATVVMDILRTHPMVIVGEVMQENPFYHASGRAAARAGVATRHSPADGRDRARRSGAADAHRCRGAAPLHQRRRRAVDAVGGVGQRPPARRLPRVLPQVLQETLDADLGLRRAAEDPSAAPCESVRLRRADDRALSDAIRLSVGRWLAAVGPASARSDVPVLSDASPGHADRHSCRARRHRDARPARRCFRLDIHRLLLNVAANQATVALLTDRAREEQRIADTLQRIGTAVAAELDPEKVVQTVTDEATALTGANFGAFFYNVVESGGRIVHAVHAGGRPARGVLAFPDAAQYRDFRADVSRARRRAPG